MIFVRIRSYPPLARLTECGRLYTISATLHRPTARVRKTATPFLSRERREDIAASMLGGETIPHTLRKGVGDLKKYRTTYVYQ